MSRHLVVPFCGTCLLIVGGSVVCVVLHADGSGNESDQASPAQPPADDGRCLAQRKAKEYVWGSQSAAGSKDNLEPAVRAEDALRKTPDSTKEFSFIGSLGRRKNPCLLFCERNEGLTDRLTLAICHPCGGWFAVHRLQLQQFGKVIFDERVDIDLYDVRLEVIHLTLRKKTYTHAEALIKGLNEGNREAIAIKNALGLRPANELASQIRDNDMGYEGAFVDYDQSITIEAFRRTFLALGDCETYSK